MSVWTVFPLLALTAGLYLLYDRGLAVTKCLAAALFVFRPGRDQDRVSLSGCTGWVRRVVRARESRVYEFSLEDRLSRGTAEAVLLDRDKRPLLRLSRRNPPGGVRLEKGKRYYLRWDFQSAAGDCRLSWRCVP